MVHRRLTVTMGLSSFFTLTTYVLPNIARIYLGGEETWFEAFEYAAIVQNLNPFFNFLIYIWRHKDMRAAVISFAKYVDNPMIF